MGRIGGLETEEGDLMSPSLCIEENKQGRLLMKNLALAAIVAAATTTAAQAGEIGATGITWGLETTAEYNVDAENMSVTTTPELGYHWSMINLTLSSDIAVYDDEFVAGDVMPTLDFKAGTHIMENLEVYVETGYDLELEDMSDIVVGATFSF